MSWTIWVGLTAARGGAGALGLVPVSLKPGALGVLNERPDMVLKIVQISLKRDLESNERLTYRSQLLPWMVLSAVLSDSSMVEDI